MNSKVNYLAHSKMVYANPGLGDRPLKCGMNICNALVGIQMHLVFPKIKMF